MGTTRESGHDGAPKQARLDTRDEPPRRTAGSAVLAPEVLDWELQVAPQLQRRLREPLAVTRKRDLLATLPEVTPLSEEHMRRRIVEGLVAAGFEAPRLRLDLRPYAGLRASLEQEIPGAFRRGEKLTMRLSDGYVDAPDQALRGLGASLGLRLFSRRHRAPEYAHMLAEFYELWQRSQDARDLQSRLRRARARKQGAGPQGDVYDLAALTGRAVARYLGGRIDPVKVTWAGRASYTVLGHHDGDLDTIVISKALDHPDVPETVVAYVLYHELLHHVMGIQEAPGHNRRLHPPAFRRRERRFPAWAQADAYLEAMCERRRPVPRARARPEWRVLWDGPWDAPEAAPGRNGRSAE